MLLATSAQILWGSAIGILHEVHEKYLPDLAILEHLPGTHSHGLDMSSPLPAALAISAALISIVSKEWIYRVTLDVGKNYNSQVIEANAWHHRTDAFSSIVAVVGVGAAYAFDIAWADQVAGLIVGGMVGQTAWGITKESVRDLTDHQDQGPVREQVSDIIKGVDGVLSFHRLRLRKMGPFYALDCHIVVNGVISVSAAHQVSFYLTGKVSSLSETSLSRLPKE